MAEIKVGQKWRNLRGYYCPTHLQEGDITTVTKIEFEGHRIWFNPSPYDDEDFGGFTDKGLFLDRFELVEELEPVADAISPSVYQFPNGVEVRSVSSTGAEKGVKASRFSLLPMEALTEVANHYGVGATKYEDHNMRRGYEWSKSYDALMRHATQFWSGEDNDEETGSKHLAAVVFHALTLMEFMETHPEFDDRYKLTK